MTLPEPDPDVLSDTAVSPYDTHAAYYVGVVDDMLGQEGGLWQVIRDCFEERLGPHLPGAALLDFACGEGHLSRHLHRYGPGQITAVDLSRCLLTVARQRTPQTNIQFLHDDAQDLHAVADGSIDIAVSNLAIMDIPDHRALFQALRRVLRPGGQLMFSMMHPCFEAPFEHPHQPQFLEQGGVREGYVIRHYAREGHWRSGRPGVRSHVGAHHRMLSTLLNDLHGAGFTLIHLAEPLTRLGDLSSRVPMALVVEAQVACS